MNNNNNYYYYYALSGWPTIFFQEHRYFTSLVALFSSVMKH